MLIFLQKKTIIKRVARNYVEETNKIKGKGRINMIVCLFDLVILAIASVIH